MLSFASSYMAGDVRSVLPYQLMATDLIEASEIKKASACDQEKYKVDDGQSRTQTTFQVCAKNVVSEWDKATTPLVNRAVSTF